MLDDLEARAETSKEALKRLVLVFRAACHISDDGPGAEPVEKPKKSKSKHAGEDGENKKKTPTAKMPTKRAPVRLVYRIPNSEIFNRVMVFCLTHMRRLLEAQLTAGGNLAKITDDMTPDVLAKAVKRSPNWNAMMPAEKTFLGSAIHVLKQLPDSTMRAFTLRHLERHTAFFAQSAPLAKQYLRELLTLWASGDETTRFLAFGNVHGLALACPQPFVDLCIRGMYLTYVRNSQFVKAATLPLLQFMRNCIAELCGVNHSAAYRVAFTYIRQLAVHLRGVILKTHTEKDAFKAIHNWQFVNALHAWSDVLVAHAPASESLKQLVFPLLQILMGVADLSSGARNLGTRFQCLHMILDLSEATGVLANPIPALVQSLDVSDMKRKPKPSDAKSLDFAVTLRVHKLFFGTNQLQEAVVAQVHEIALRFLASHSCSIAFPELALPAVVFLKRCKKECKVPQLARQITALLEKVQENVDFVNKHRSKVDFSPRDVDRVRSFLAEEKAQGCSPLSQAWRRFKQQRAVFKTVQSKAEAKKVRKDGRPPSKKQKKHADEEEDDVEEEEEEREYSDHDDGDDEEEELEEEEEEDEEERDDDGEEEEEEMEDEVEEDEDEEETPKDKKRKRKN